MALIEAADFEVRQEALREAVKRLPEIPEAQATAWLKAVFASERLAAAALEVIALDAMNLRQSNLGEAERAQQRIAGQLGVYVESWGMPSHTPPTEALQPGAALRASLPKRQRG